MALAGPRSAVGGAYAASQDGCRSHAPPLCVGRGSGCVRWGEPRAGFVAGSKSRAKLLNAAIVIPPEP